MKDIVKFENIELEINYYGEKYASSIEKRCKKSKFAKMISKMTNRQIQALGYCLLVDPQVKEVIDCYSQAVDHIVQLYALKYEYDLRKEEMERLERGKQK